MQLIANGRDWSRNNDENADERTRVIVEGKVTG
jgi:hypothetical protein